jgi:hypothetical protein
MFIFYYKIFDILINLEIMKSFLLSVSCITWPIGIVKVPISGWTKLVNIMSKTWQVNFGQYNLSRGRVISKSMTVLMFGLEPGWIGLVRTLLSAAEDMLGGSKLFILNFTKAFYTGNSPVDSSFLSPSTLLRTLYSATFTNWFKLTYVISSL